MDGHPCGASHGTELGLQTASLAQPLISCVNGPRRVSVRAPCPQFFPQFVHVTACLDQLADTLGDAGQVGRQPLDLDGRGASLRQVRSRAVALVRHRPPGRGPSVFRSAAQVGRRSRSVEPTPTSYGRCARLPRGPYSLSSRGRHRAARGAITPAARRPVTVATRRVGPMARPIHLGLGRARPGRRIECRSNEWPMFVPRRSPRSPSSRWYLYLQAAGPKPRSSRQASDQRRQRRPRQLLARRSPRTPLSCPSAFRWPVAGWCTMISPAT